jgi:hypothetical protein
VRQGRQVGGECRLDQRDPRDNSETADDLNLYALSLIGRMSADQHSSA